MLFCTGDGVRAEGEAAPTGHQPQLPAEPPPETVRDYRTAPFFVYASSLEAGRDEAVDAARARLDVRGFGWTENPDEALVSVSVTADFESDPGGALTSSFGGEARVTLMATWEPDGSLLFIGQHTAAGFGVSVPAARKAALADAAATLTDQFVARLYRMTASGGP